MGMDYIGGGVTVDHDVKVESVRAVVEQFREQIIEKIEYIDVSESFPSEVYTDEEIIEALIEGAEWIDHGRRFQTTWDIPGYPNLEFVTFGGMSWGDDPFEGFSSVCLAGNAVEVIPELGRSLGILGGGIRLTYGADSGKL